MEVLPFSKVPAAEAFLRQTEEQNLFLLGNLARHGPQLTDHPNSANFKVVLKGEEVVAVFALTKRGNLLLATLHSPPTSHILDSCAQEKIPVLGLIGPAHGVLPAWKEICRRSPQTRVKYESLEEMYRLDLSGKDFSDFASPACRPMEEGDFSLWLRLLNQFLAEEGLPDDLSDEQRRVTFSEKVKNRELWGFFENGQLLSMAAVNAKVRTMIQLGGVFTLTQKRRQGLSKACISALLQHFSQEGIEKVVLFTGKQNSAARELYEALGFESIGDYALFLGISENSFNF
jgi:predicted GNAT family acetyltransferase